MKILVANHSADALQTINTQLQLMACDQIHLVDSAKEALWILGREELDLVILDVDTPDLDGWRLSRLVRCGILRCPPNLPIILTAATWCERIAEVTAREYGINFLLPLEQIDQLPEVVAQFSQKIFAELQKPRLLVVEDQQDTADLIVRILANAFEIDVAQDGLEGLKVWKKGRHDLVLLDVMLPRLSGQDILIEIQTIDPHQPVVIMTAHSAAEQAEELMFLGAVDFLPKPFRAEQLRKVCDIALHREDYLVSNAQFAARVRSLEDSERAYKDLYEDYHQLLDDLQSVVMELDDQLNICFLNRRWESMMGFKIADCVNTPIEKYLASESAAQFLIFKEKVNAALYQQKTCDDFELCFKDYRNRKIWAQLKISRSSNTAEKSTLTVCLDNITERRATQEQLKYLAMHDSLTGLYNRHFFEMSLAQLSEDARKNNRLHALLYLDLDHFKVINDTFGHQKGDEALREISSVLSKKIRKPNLLCRLGGDEFAILLHDVIEREAQEFARGIQKLVGEFNFHSQEQYIHLGCSLGFTLIDGRTERAEEYLMQSDIALYVAKGRGRNLIHRYDPEDNESDELRHRLNVSQQIRKAIAEDRMVLYFQPIYDMKTLKVSYYEALIRLREPNGDIIEPLDFIPALEASGEVHLLDAWIIKLAARTLKAHPELMHIAINLSAQAFQNDNLVPSIIDALKESGVNANRITFELTESASLFNLNITQQVIHDLHKLGCGFSVDDFGSGFSSFAYLKDLPADYIKLDGSFIQNLHQDPVDQALVKAMIQVIQALGKKAVAEFVENEEILRILKSMGIDFVQGYHLGIPMDVEKINKKIPHKKKTA